MHWVRALIGSSLIISCKSMESSEASRRQHGHRTVQLIHSSPQIVVGDFKNITALSSWHIIISASLSSSSSSTSSSSLGDIASWSRPSLKYPLPPSSMNGLTQNDTSSSKFWVSGHRQEQSSSRSSSVTADRTVFVTSFLTIWPRSWHTTLSPRTPTSGLLSAVKWWHDEDPRRRWKVLVEPRRDLRDASPAPRPDTLQLKLPIADHSLQSVHHRSAWRFTPNHLFRTTGLRTVPYSPTIEWRYNYLRKEFQI